MSPSNAPEMLAEIKVGSVDWANVTPYLLSEQSPVVITRGKSDANAQASPAQLTLELDNESSVFSPKNPNSPVWGMIGRNTPVRVSIGRGKFGLVTQDSSNGTAFTLDSPGTSVTGDIDIRVDLEILAGSTRTWTSSDFDVASKWTDFDTQRSWTMRVVGGQIRFKWWALGTLASERSLLSSTSVPGPATGRKTLRVTLDVDNGAGGCTATFYTGTSLAGPWTQVGSPVVSAGTTAIFDGSAGTRIGGASFAAVTPYATFYGAEIRNGIGGTVVASPNFEAQQLDPVPFGFSSFTDAQGNNWAPSGSADAARIWYGDVDVRAVQEIANKSPNWALTNQVKRVPVTANGLLRRLGQGNDPAPSGLRDYLMSTAGLVSYFPLSGEEGTRYSVNLGSIYTNSTRFYPVGQFATYTYGRDLGASWLGSGALEINATPSSNMQADVATGDQSWAFDMVFQSLAMGVLEIVFWSYDNDRWKVTLQDPGDTATVTVTFYDGTTGVSTPFVLNGGAPFQELQDNTAIHTMRFGIQSGLGSTFFFQIDGGTTYTNGVLPGRPFNGMSAYQMFYERYAGQTYVNLAHLAVHSGGSYAGLPSAADFTAAANGYVGETAHARMTRVAALNGIPLVIEGAAADTMPMGAQYSESKLTQLRDAESADMGILTETRDQIALLYRTRRSMYNQTPALTIDYGAKQLSPPFEPVEDDQLTANDVTATRRDGDSREAVKLTGPLSVQDPPAGVGRYRNETTVNVRDDAMLDGIANWLLTLGTVDEYRFPQLTIDTGAPDCPPALAAAAAATEIGDLAVITNAGAVDMPDDIRLLVLQITETIENLAGHPSQVFVFTCAPAVPYDVAVWGTGPGVGPDRYDSTWSTLNGNHSSGATTLSVASNGALWTTDPAAFPLDVNVAGERIRITSITGATSPQTFAVGARAVNGVVKAPQSGSQVRLWKTPRYAL